MSGPPILVVEDEPPLQELLGYNLKKAGYRPVSATSGSEAIDRIASEIPALILLDVMLPDTDGFALCRRLRRQAGTKSIPIIMVTAKGEDADVVRGLEAGADDYITKPFNLPVLLARIHAVLRRRDDEQPNDASPLAIRNVSLHPGRHELRVDDEKVELTSTEFRILHLLMRRPGWVFSRQQIVDGVRGANYAVTERAVDVQVVSLRRKLGSAADAIETVRGVGYRFREE
jgi:two-component system phosphate regulon response regulator PhoB